MTTTSEFCINCFYFDRQSKNLGECSKYTKKQMKFIGNHCEEYIFNLFEPYEYILTNKPLIKIYT